MDAEIEFTREPREGEVGEVSPSEIDQPPPFFDQNSKVKNRSKSSLRIRYEAETEVIRRKLGSLETIRGQLGISQRKMCQLLLVDPSAWSRWVREDEDAPPHIYRMLQWYLALQEKYPALDVNFWLSTVTRAQEPLRLEIQESKLAGVPDQIEVLQSEITRLERSLEDQKQNVTRLARIAALAAGAALFLLLALIVFKR